MAQESASLGFGTKLLIICFALGMVAIGLHPIRKDIRGAAREAQSFFQRNFPSLGDFNSDTDFSSTRRASALEDTVDVPTIVPGRKPAAVILEPEAAKKLPVDKLTQKDRKQLSDLVNGF